MDSTNTCIIVKKPTVCSVRLIQSTLTEPNLYMLISLCNSVPSCPSCLITPPCPRCQSSLCPLLVCRVTSQGIAKISSLKSCRGAFSTANLNCFESVGVGPDQSASTWERKAAAMGGRFIVTKTGSRYKHVIKNGHSGDAATICRFSRTRHLLVNIFEGQIEEHFEVQLS